jgi:hypothetical protein
MEKGLPQLVGALLNEVTREVSHPVMKCRSLPKALFVSALSRGSYINLEPAINLPIREGLCSENK